MKKLLLSLLAVAVCVGSSFAAPQPKVKTVKIADNAVFEGVTLKNKPLGKGTLTLGFCGTLSGEFNNLEVSNGKLILKEHKRVITGDFSMSIYKEVKEQPQSSDLALIKLIKAASKYKFLEITIKNGKFNNRPIVGEATMKYENGAYVIVLKSAYSPKLPSEFMGIIKQFVGDKVSYKITDVDGVAQYRIDNKNIKRKILQDATTVTLNFKNGAVAKINLQNSSYTLTRPNGDFVSVASDGIKGYKITGGNSVIEAGKITHTFENGNKYIGAVEGELADYCKVKDINTLHSFKGLTWAWADFKKYADNGKLIYADGKSDNIIGGITEAEMKALEAEKKALRKNDTFVADANGKITSCTITYRDGVVFHYSAANEQCEYVYKNGDKMGLCAAENFTKEKYEKLLTDLAAPAITDLKHDAKYRHFANGYKFDEYDKYLTTPKDKKGEYIKYRRYDGEYKPYEWYVRMKDGVSLRKHEYISITKKTDDISYVKYDNGNVWWGAGGDRGYARNPDNDVQAHPFIKSLGINVSCGIKELANPVFLGGYMLNSSNELIAAWSSEGEKWTKEMLDAKGLTSQMESVVRSVLSIFVCEYLIKKYPDYIQEINTFVSQDGFAKGTPIGFIRDVTNNLSGKQGKRMETVKGNVRTISLYYYGVEFAQLKVDERTGKLISWEVLINGWQAYYAWYNLHSGGWLDSFKMTMLLDSVCK
ncbi:MAG: hypothetical protein IKL20_00890 [Alistipes sp.]|nr:hypothetical protein [Alistipes sp.]